MQKHHYLGALPRISKTLRYVVTFSDQWIALLSFFAAALKYSPRDRWIGWDFRHQYDRLKLLTNNSRFLILPDRHVPNPASRFLSLCQKRLPADWRAVFGHPVVLPETFVDPQRFRGTIYRAAKLDICGRHQRISSDPARLHRYGRVTENGFCQAVNFQCAGPVIPACSRNPLLYRRSKNHAQCTTHEVPA